MDTSSTQPEPTEPRAPAEHLAATESIEPGPALATHLASIDTTTLTDHDLLDTIADWERLAAWVAAGQLAAAADFARRPSRAERPGEDPASVSSGWARPGRWVRDFADDEIASRLKITRRDAANRIGIGCALTGLPRTRASLAGGRIDLRRATVIAEETRLLDAAAAFEVDAAMNATAERLPATRLRARVRTAVIHADPAAARRRAQVARGERKVMVIPADDGMADLWAHLPAVEALEIQRAITAAAHASKLERVPGDDRTMDQRKADFLAAPFTHALATGELVGHRMSRRRGRPMELQVTVAASTLLGLDDASAHLQGYGAITADAVRELAPASALRRVLTDPLDGTVLDVGTTVYRPPAPILRHVEVRDQLCTFPCCNAPAEASEYDHTVPFPLGSTSVTNGRMRCKRHHDVKTKGVAIVELLPDGTSRWTMPTGHTYDVPLPRVGPVTQPPPLTEQPPPGPDDGGTTDATSTGTGTDPGPPEVPPF